MRTALLFAAFAGAACSTDTCRTLTADVGETCLPDALAPDRQLVIEVRELCGRGCSSLPSCTVLQQNGQLVLDMRQDVCNEALFLPCTAAPCLHRSVRCKLSALHPGDYPLLAPGAPTQLVRVRAGGVASCRFPDASDGGT
jgi:hypothetical protein